MFTRRVPSALLGALAAAALAAFPKAARAVDEIQVYNAEINRPRQFSLQLHGNTIVKGIDEPDFPGGLVPEGSLNGTPEFAYGVLAWWEVGLYLPYAVEPGPTFYSGGAKLRTLFVSPNAAQRRFFYGLNIEISHATDKFSQEAWGSEMRPIIGWRWSHVELIVNPIVDMALSGDDRVPVFVPATRLAWLATRTWAFGLEHYADFGPLHDFVPLEEQSQELFAVADRSTPSFDIDFGVGHGFTDASNDWTVKFILSWSF